MRRENLKLREFASTSSAFESQRKNQRQTKQTSRAKPQSQVSSHSNRSSSDVSAKKPFVKNWRTSLNSKIHALSPIKKDELFSKESSLLNQFTIHLSEVEFGYNNHVGNEWYYGVTLNDKKLGIGQSRKLNFNDISYISIYCSATEGNETFNDRSSESVGLTQYDINCLKDNAFYIPVIVREDNGRYAGNTAELQFHFTVN